MTTVEFAMAYGETQNFSIPIFSGFFSFLCTFKRKIVSAVQIQSKLGFLSVPVLRGLIVGMLCQENAYFHIFVMNPIDF